MRPPTAVAVAGFFRAFARARCTMAGVYNVLRRETLPAG
jgi:hypothetical protein